MKQDMIVILDLGSTENTTLARQIRDLGVYSEIHPHDITPEGLKSLPNVKGVILNGGKNRVVDGTAVEIDPVLYACGFPMLAVDHPTARCDRRMETLPEEADLKEFVLNVCGAQANWNMKNFIEDQVELVRKQVGQEGAAGPVRRCGFVGGGCPLNPGHRPAAGMCPCEPRPYAEG